MQAGLCGTCRHHRWITSGRGSRFLLCELSKSDPRFERYPPLPMFDCPGFEPEAGGAPDAAADEELPDDFDAGGEG